MADFAHIDSISVLSEFRAAIWKFAEIAQVALGDAESDLMRTLMWLENEQSQYWTGQIRKRQQIVATCAEKYREKRLFKDSSGRIPTAIDEERALRLAQRRLEEAEEKLAAVKKYIRITQKAIHDYKGSVQGLQSAVAQDIPLAVARLDKLSSLLRQYVELAPVSAGEADLATSDTGQPMGRQGGGPADAPAIPTSIDELPDFPTFEPPTVVLVHTHRPTGIVLAADGKTPADAGNQYRPFASQEEAEQYARLKVEADRLIGCAIYRSDRTRASLIEPAAS